MEKHEKEFIKMLVALISAFVFGFISFYALVHSTGIESIVTFFVLTLINAWSFVLSLDSWLEEREKYINE